MHKLSFKEKLGFSLGELGGSGFWQIFVIFLPIFYTDVFGIPAVTAGGIFLFVRLLDAVTDPLMGLLADRTRTRWGRFRPWILWMAVPLALAGLALFWAPDLDDKARIVYAYASYSLMMVVFTMSNIPYYSLSGVMTNDPDQRTSLNSYRFFLAFAAAALVQRFFGVGVRFFGGGDVVLGTRWTMLFVGLLAVAGFVVTFLSTQERVQPVAAEQSNVRDDLKDLLKNRAWMIVVLLSMINAISYGIRAGAQTYYFKYYVGDEAMVASFMTWGTACTMLGIVITPFLVKLMDKRRLFIATQVASVLLNLVFYWVQPGQTELLFGLQMLLQFVAAPTMPLMTAMMADVADFSEWRTGRRATGLVFSASTFSGKAGGALGGLVGMLVLSAYGYVANQEQNPQVLEGMRHMMSFYPALGAAAMVASLCFYNLDRQTIERINGELKRRLNAKG